jgi:diadenylate cyclase
VIETLLSIRLAELVDLAVVWLMVWAGLAWLRTTPARMALAGLGILVVAYLVARQLGLVLTTWILQGFAAVSVLVAVVVFQQDLRRLFEQIATLSLRPRMLPTGPDAVDVMVRAITRLAEQHRGALIVIPGREPVEGHVEGGLSLDGLITEPLLLSIFDPNSPGHDGAIIVSGNRLTRFAVHLPLSTDHAQLVQRGTRHAAALGLAERTDALCIAVSEERGTVSVAEDGRLRTLPRPEAVLGRIREFYARLIPSVGRRPARLKRLAHRWREALLAVPIAAVLWVLAIPGGTVIEVEREVPVSVTGVTAPYVLEEVDPEQVRVAITGRRRDLYLLRPGDLKVSVDAVLVELGRRSFSISPENVQHPEAIEVRAVNPDRVKISVEKQNGGSEEKAVPNG